MIDFTLSEDQAAVAELTETIFVDYSQPDRLTQIENSDADLDRDLWNALASAGLLGVCVSQDVGGAGQGVMELCAALEVQGRHVAHVPLLAATVGGMAVDRFATARLRQRLLPEVVSGAAIVAPALQEIGARLPTDPDALAHDVAGTTCLSGLKISVSGGAAATHFLVVAASADGRTGLFLVDRAASGVTVTRVRTTNREMQAHLRLVDSPATRIGDAEAVSWLYHHYLVGVCAIQVGVVAAAVRLAASYTSTRKQFGKPLTYFQAVLVRGADAYMDLAAMRATTWYAAWELAQGRDAAISTATAKWWCSESGNRAVHSMLYVHGGMGNDVSYPVHRYYLWGKQIDASLGGPAQQLETIGAGLVAS